MATTSPSSTPSPCVDHIDLLMLSVKAPLADAVCATVCRRWREAVDLWLDVCREPSYRSLSAQCGLEAALRSGSYDLAQYFYIGLAEAPLLPDFLAAPWRESAPIRRNRTRFYSCLISAAEREGISRIDPRRFAQDLVEVRLYREAIREIFRTRLYWTSRGFAVSTLAACYSALGEHEALVALNRSRGLYLGGRNERSMLKNARTCLDRANSGILDNVREFTRTHPAGDLLTSLLKPREPVFATHE